MLLKKILNKLKIYRVYKLDMGVYKVRIPIYKDNGFANLNDAEPWMTTLLSILGQTSNSLMDVGANVGQTLVKWKGQFPDKTYIGFEPNLNCIDYLKMLTKENNFTSTFIYPFAIAQESATKKLYLPSRNYTDSAASLIKDFRKNQNTLAVDIHTKPLSEFDIKGVDLIKIDVEGFELAVIESIVQTKLRCPIICEVLPVYTLENVERLNRQADLEKILGQENYLIYRVNKSDIVTIDQINEIGIHGNINQCDYIFVPLEDKEKIEALFA